MASPWRVNEDQIYQIWPGTEKETVRRFIDGMETLLECLLDAGVLMDDLTLGPVRLEYSLDTGQFCLKQCILQKQ